MRNFGWFASALFALFGSECSAYDDPLARRALFGLQLLQPHR
jgi:hypothetical protein